jgi:hypothetical protein
VHGVVQRVEVDAVVVVFVDSRVVLSHRAVTVAPVGRGLVLQDENVD